MAYPNLENQTVNNTLFSPVEQVYPLSEKRYDCKTIPDLDFAKLGVLRCLSSAVTGDEFIQNHALETAEFYETSHFFKTLQSKRRLANITSLNSLIKGTAKEILPDAFDRCEELDNFDIYAGDGHYLQAACFDSEKRGKKRPAGHFFRLDLRNHHLDYIALEKPDWGKVKKHDARIIQEADPQALRNHAPGEGKSSTHGTRPAWITTSGQNSNTTTASTSSPPKNQTVRQPG